MADERWRQLYRYWLSKHADGRPPSREDLDPILEIPRLVSNLMLMDVVAEGYRYCVLGSDIADRHRVALTGKFFGSSGVDKQALIELRAALDWVVANHKPMLLEALMEGKERGKNTMLILPLVSADGRVHKILAGSFYNEYFDWRSRRAGMLAKVLDP